MSRFINRVEGADEASVAALRKRNAELVEALQAIARDYENQNLSHRAFRIAAMGHVNVGLAKIGGIE